MRRLLCSLCLLASTLIAQQPNIVFVLIDDMGWAGTSVQIDPTIPSSKGEIFETPQLEKLATEGIRLTNAYAPGPMCTPSRAGILTGKTPAEIKMTTPGGGRSQDYHRLTSGTKDQSLSTQLDTIAHTLKAAGYATAHLGKWHIGRQGPEHYGYDLHDGNTANESPNSSPENPKDIFGITQRACDFMSAQVEAGTPFYLQLSHYAVHTPIEARESSKARFSNVRSRGKDDAQGRAAMTYDIDDSLTLLRAKITELGIEEHTYFVVMSDNGGNGGGSRRGSGSALNSGKGSLQEGGIRVPFFAVGPGIQANTLSRESITGCDLFPTFCEWAGAPIPDNLAGTSLANLLSGKVNTLPERALLFHYPHYGHGPRQKPQSALILGDHKTLFDWETQTAQLFNLRDDLGEQTDLSAREPQKAAAMLARLSQELKAIDASLPQTNPNYDPNAEAPTKREKHEKQN